LLYDLISYICRLFIDDIRIKGPDLTFNDEEVILRVRRYVLLYLINVDKVLVNLKLGGAIALVIKIQWYRTKGSFLGYLYSIDGRELDPKKVIKLVE
jgi:hypothetical protein